MKILFQSRKTLFNRDREEILPKFLNKEYLEKAGCIVDITLELEPDLSGYDIVHVLI